jgi:hypothetical protein
MPCFQWYVGTLGSVPSVSAREKPPYLAPRLPQTSLRQCPERRCWLSPVHKLPAVSPSCRRERRSPKIARTVQPSPSASSPPVSPDAAARTLHPDCEGFFMFALPKSRPERLHPDRVGCCRMQIKIFCEGIRFLSRMAVKQIDESTTHHSYSE